MFCTQDDVEKRLRRSLTDDEVEYLDGMIEEATDLVLAYLECPPDKYGEDVPKQIVRVVSRMVARVIQEGEVADPVTFGATQVGMTAGPMSGNVSFQAGSRTGAPWLTRVDKGLLDQFRCGGKAFSIDTAPRQGCVHDETCSAMKYRGAEYWTAYCTCGADIAGVPIYGVDDVLP